MVAVKGLSTFKSRVSAERETRKIVAGGVRGFKVYTENEKVKTHSQDHVAAEAKKKSIPVKAEASQIQANFPKGALNKLDKIHGKNINSTQSTVARKVLADISNNSQGNLQKNETFDGSKLGKVKLEKMTYSQRASIGTKTRNASSLSAKLSMGTRVGSQSVAVNSRLTIGKVGTKDLKVFNGGNPRTRPQGKETVGNLKRESLRIYRPPQRNSLPVLKHAEKMDTCDLKKGNLGTKVKSKEKFGFSVKPKVGTTVVPQVSSTQGTRLKNRVSDGSIKMMSEGESTGKTKILSRRSMKPTVKTTIGIPKVSITRRTSVFSKQTSSTCVLSKKKEEISTTTTATASTSTSNPTAKGTTKRRKSYTSSLIEGSKMLKDIGSVKKEVLPDIYDDRNQLEVSEYVDEIYQHYWVTEAHHQSLKNYMEIQTDITPQMRGILINWLIEVHLKFDLMQETLYLMVTLLDYYLSAVTIKKNEMQLVGLTALLLASKYEDFWHPKVMELISISAELYTRDQMLTMETTILDKLNFRLNLPTPYVFMLRFLRAAKGSKEFENLAFFLVELSLVEYDALDFKPSLLCASAIYLARCTLHVAPPWTPLLSKHTHYQEFQIRDCAEMILKFHRAARKSMMKVTYNKYMSDHNFKVASIRPLTNLPSP